jgi:SAM-dependent methyltransferase
VVMAAAALPGPLPGSARAGDRLRSGPVLRTIEQNFGCVPHGVDFSPTPFAQTRENFQEWEYDPNNVTQAGVLDPAFQRDSRDRLDVVFSRGFIGHFTGELPAIIEAHVDAVRPGGLLIVTIPNDRGLNYALGRPTVPHLYPEHNFAIPWASSSR